MGVYIFTDIEEVIRVFNFSMSIWFNSDRYNKIWEVKKVIRICQLYQWMFYMICHVIDCVICPPFALKKGKKILILELQ